MIKELRKEVAALTDMKSTVYPPALPGPINVNATDGDCAALRLEVRALADVVKLLEQRIGRLETMLTPDDRGYMVGLPPIYMHKRNMETGEETTEEVYLGEGFLFKLYPHKN